MRFECICDNGFVRYVLTKNIKSAVISLRNIKSADDQRQQGKAI